MKILFLIYTGKFGQGGHLHSLNTISRHVAEGYDVNIVTFGWVHCEVLCDNPYFTTHITTKGFSSLLAPLKLLKTFHKVEPDIIHCFDYPSFYYSVLLDPLQKFTVVNRCGGPNPSNAPYVKRLLVFSQENYDWLKRLHPKSYIQLTPNRVEEKNPSFYVGRKEFDKSDDFIFLRTCRLSEGYRKSIFDAVALIEKLNDSFKIKSKLIVMGDIQSEALFNELVQKEACSAGRILVVTESSFTKETAKYLNVADAIIGVGRSAAEGASLSKPILAIDANGDTPILLKDKFTWQSALRTNISERNVFSNEQRNENMQAILEMIADEDYRRKVGNLSYRYFLSFYSTQRILPEYKKLYEYSNSLARVGGRHVFIRAYRAFKLLVKNLLKIT